MVTIDRALLPELGSALPSASPGRLVLSVHDELLFEVAEDSAHALRRLVRNAMTSVASLRVPLRVLLKQGPSWGQLEEVADN